MRFTSSLFISLNVFLYLQAELITQHEQGCMTLNQMSGTIQELQGQLATSQQDGATLTVRTPKPNHVASKVKWETIIKLRHCTVEQRNLNMCKLTVLQVFVGWILAILLWYTIELLISRFIYKGASRTAVRKNIKKHF